MNKKPTRPLPEGFHCAGIHAGVGKKPEKPDMALFYSEVPCSTAALFTTNLVKAAPVLVSREHVKGGTAQVIVVNSGCANACTGKQGLSDAKEMGRLTAREMGVGEKLALVASTGVIGAFLPMPKVRAGISELARQVSRSAGSFSSPPHTAVQESVRAFMTTDTVPKTARQVLQFGSKRATIWGCAKGAGMIAPKMATMLSFILTDAKVSAKTLQKMLKVSAGDSFNILTVDSDTSTNDCVFLLANGASGAEVRSARDMSEFQKALNEVCISLAEQMASDGEGATKRIEIYVRGAASAEAAQTVARTVADSPLVKTAFFGRDANWGRIIAAVGRSGVKVNPERIDIAFNNLRVARNGAAIRFSESKAKKILSQKVVKLDIDLKMGKAQARFLTCDFSLDYVKINASYRS